jgi:hypothetical protein
LNYVCTPIGMKPQLADCIWLPESRSEFVGTS